MKRKRLFWQIYPAFVLIIILSLWAVGWFTAKSIRNFYLERLTAELATQAFLLQTQIAENLRLANWKQTEQICKSLGEKISTRITIILPSGKVVGDSDEKPSIMENHADRPEIMAAYNGKTGVSTRLSPTLKKQMLYVAIPVYEHKQLLGVVRTSIALTDINQSLKIIFTKIIFILIGLSLLVALISLGIARRISKPLEDMKNYAQRLARGDFTFRIPLPEGEEMGSLAEAMNQMAKELDSRIRMISEQRNELEAVLSSMIECVIAVDKEENILSINQATRQLFNIGTEKVKGRNLQEICRNTDIQAFIVKALNNKQSVEAELTICLANQPHYLQAHSTLLKDADGNEMGVLIVLNDVTRLHNLEKIRRDFVANVSHELKTPITSIRGFTETLLSGVMEPQEVNRFLTIIAKHTERLNAIIDDLLTLSRLEKDGESQTIEKEETDIMRIIELSGEVCGLKASEKGINLELNGPENLTAVVNPLLLEQAITNLIDNAIKYSEPKSKIFISAKQNENQVIISIQDNGCGIPRDELPRIFERFYRIDKSRSRKLGGTGLGLAIVKHIVQVFDGRIEVESQVGKGSTFTIFLPQK